MVREIDRINALELKQGIYGGGKGSWHEDYKDSAWVYIGGLNYELSEGDVICVMSQWGEIEDVNLVRDKETGKSMGFCFIKFEDQRSTILAVDNFNGVKLLGSTLRVDHVENYRLPKNVMEREAKKLEDNPDAEVVIGPGSTYTDKELANDFTITTGVNPFDAVSRKQSASEGTRQDNSGSSRSSKKRSRDDDGDDGYGNGEKAEKKAEKKAAKKAEKKEKKENDKEMKKELKKLLKKAEKRAEKKKEKKEKKKGKKETV